MSKSNCKATNKNELLLEMATAIVNLDTEVKDDGERYTTDKNIINSAINVLKKLISGSESS